MQFTLLTCICHSVCPSHILPCHLANDPLNWASNQQLFQLCQWAHTHKSLDPFFVIQTWSNDSMWVVMWFDLIACFSGTGQMKFKTKCWKFQSSECECKMSHKFHVLDSKQCFASRTALGCSDMKPVQILCAICTIMGKLRTKTARASSVPAFLFACSMFHNASQRDNSCNQHFGSSSIHFGMFSVGVLLFFVSLCHVQLFDVTCCFQSLPKVNSKKHWQTNSWTCLWAHDKLLLPHRPNKAFFYWLKHLTNIFHWFVHFCIVSKLNHKVAISKVCFGKVIYYSLTDTLIGPCSKLQKDIQNLAVSKGWPPYDNVTRTESVGVFFKNCLSTLQH